jgi:acetyl-CoA carboxylase carboxyl transferase subunit beta
MPWFRREKAGIRTTREEQNEMPEGQWVKCPNTGEITNRRELENNLLVFPGSGYHFGMDSHKYFDFLFDDGNYDLHDTDLRSVDALDFEDRKSYAQRLESAVEDTGQNEAAQAATGTVGGHPVSMAGMDFSFIGGSMGSVVGEIVARAVKRAYTEEMPLITIAQSGGARMMEGALSLMQMAKTSAHLTHGGRHSVLCDARRHPHCGAGRPDRVRRAAGHPRNDRVGPAGGLSEVRVFAGARLCGHGGGSPPDAPPHYPAA